MLDVIVVVIVVVELVTEPNWSKGFMVVLFPSLNPIAYLPKA